MHVKMSFYEPQCWWCHSGKLPVEKRAFGDKFDVFWVFYLYLISQVIMYMWDFFVRLST